MGQSPKDDGSFSVTRSMLQSLPQPRQGQMLHAGEHHGNVIVPLEDQDDARLAAVLAE